MSIHAHIYFAVPFESVNACGYGFVEGHSLPSMPLETDERNYILLHNIHALLHHHLLLLHFYVPSRVDLHDRIGIA